MLTDYLKPSKEIPKRGFGHKDGKHDGDKAVLIIKTMVKHHIENAVLDEVGALDGTRPLETTADACSYGWGTTCLQMSTDLTRFNVLMMVGGSLDASQQAWPPLTLEAYAQLGKTCSETKPRPYAVYLLD